MKTLLAVLLAVLLTAYVFVLYCNTLDLHIENQQARIARLETKICFLENNDWALIIQQLPPIVQDELKLLNTRIKLDKLKIYDEKYKRKQVPVH